MSRIIRLESNNIMCLKAIDITPGDGSIVKLVGANDAGKTANLKCIWMALGGKKEIPADAIRAGEDTGFVTLTIGDGDKVEYTVRMNLRRRENGTIADSLILKDERGRTVSSPMAMLANMLGFGRAQFDPLLFAGAKPADQVAMLKTALGLDFSELDAEYDDQYAERTIINRQATELAAQIGGTVNDPDAPDTEASVVGLVEEHGAMLDAKARNEKHQAAIAEATCKVESAITQYQALKLQEEELGKTIATLQADVEVQNQAIDVLKAQPLSEVGDIDAITRKIASAESDNVRARAKSQRKEQLVNLRELKAKSEVFTQSLALIADTKKHMVAEAKLPITGVEIDDDQILVNGHPLANQGGAAQLRFGALLVMMSEPRLKIITMDEALGKLDDEALEMLDVLLEQHGFQAWLTGPRAVGEGCIEIRNGEIVTAAKL